PPSNTSLALLPIFSDEKLKCITANDLHQGFKCGSRLSELVISQRTSNVLRTLKVTTIGELMFFPYRELLRKKNFGQKCLKEVHEIIRIAVFGSYYRQLSSGSVDCGDKEHSLDYSSYENLVASYTRHSLKNK